MSNSGANRAPGARLATAGGSMLWSRLRSRVRFASAKGAMPNALIVDDDEAFHLGLAEVVRREGFDVAVAGTLKQAREELARQRPDIVFMDLRLPDGSGLELLSEPEGRPDTVLITGEASVETAVEALRLGLTDYLTKPVDLARVKMVLANVSRTQELKQEIGSLRGKLRELGRFGSLLGACDPMQRVYDLVAKVAPTDTTILITGETGTGKELVAETVHRLSRRSREAFLPLNCGAVSPTLIESELFGHERGSFTGADRVHKGHFERANRGTLFLDEITEMPIELQTKLLRVLETSTFTRVGGSSSMKVDVRVVAATNRRPEDALSAGKLREDLLYRLNVFPVHMPPLSERGADVELLAEHFLGALNKRENTAKRFTPAALERLRLHRWPGNVRELKNAIQRAFILCEDTIDADSLPLGVAPEAVGNSQTMTLKMGISIRDAERRLILATLDHLGGDKQKAAEVLGMSVKTLYNRLNTYRGALGGGARPSEDGTNTA
jgi:two-component system response regulator AtoC